jgi:hypothetical protein
MTSLYSNIDLKYILGHLKKMFWFSDNGFKEKGKVGRVFILSFGRSFILFCKLKTKNLTNKYLFLK